MSHVIHDAAGPCEPGYHRAKPDGSGCRCGALLPDGSPLHRYDSETGGWTCLLCGHSTHADPCDCSCLHAWQEPCLDCGVVLTAENVWEPGTCKECAKRLTPADLHGQEDS